MVTPSIVRVVGTQTQTFNASLLGSQLGVDWSIDGVGSINGGFYQAPVIINTPQKVTVTATSREFPTVTASSIMWLDPTWRNVDIGPVNAPGSFSCAKGAFTITGAGDVAGKQDAFHYSYFPITGDFVFTARYAATTPCCTDARKAGLMIRASTAPDDAHAFMSVYSAIVGLFEARATQGGTTSADFGGVGAYWMRIIRSGALISGYISTNGVQWMRVPGNASTFTLPTTQVLVGFAVSSGFGPASGAIFDNVSFQTSSTISLFFEKTLMRLGPSQTSYFTVRDLSSTNNIVFTVDPAGQGTAALIGGGDGYYTAPFQLFSSQSATVTATSLDDPAVSASVVIQLGGPAQPVRINAGGPAHIDPNGIYWNADTNFSTAGNANVFSSGTPVTGTNDSYLYQSERFAPSNLVYKFDVLPGVYNIKLKFAEIFFTLPGQRLFQAQVNGGGASTVFRGLDIVSLAGGPNKVYDLLIPNYVVDGLGQLTITLASDPPGPTNAPKINAIEITPAP